MKNFKAGIEFKLSCIVASHNKYRKNDPLVIVPEFEDRGDSLWLHLSHGEQRLSLSFPTPYSDGYSSQLDSCSNYVMGDRVTRSVGTWHCEGKEFSYWQLMLWMMTGRIENSFVEAGRKSQLDRIVSGFLNDNAPLAFRSVQKLVGGVINDLPLAGTPLQTWAMCNRVVFIDPKFAELTPQKALDYQKDLNIKHYPWTSIGLSDSGMCNNNLLKVDLRTLTPFGIRHHNPMRNLYQTLGMKGDELPLIKTESAARLGIERMGWNLMTCFLDTPLNFEDQLIVDNRHLDKFTVENRKFICFGDVKVVAGDELSGGTTLSMEPNGKPLRYWIRADNAVVTDVANDKVSFNGQDRSVKVVYVTTKHAFKEGIKLTNYHGNKGVVAFADCGNMFDAGRGKDTPIDIIVSAKTIGKRKNYGQVLEALSTLISGPDQQVVIPDDASITLDNLKQVLASKGYSSDGTSPVKTQWFTGGAICGWGFWGLIKNPEGQLWTKADTEATDNRERRTAGLKVSHIELKGLTTIFGPQNPVVKEILSHQQGIEDVHEMVACLDILRGKSIACSTLNWSSVKPLVQREGYFHSKGELSGTIIDENLIQEGFVMELPRRFRVFIPDDQSAEVTYKLIPERVTDLEEYAEPEGENIFLNRVYIPHISLRASWNHPTGLWGLSDIGGYLNNVAVACHRVGRGEASDPVLERALVRYFHQISRRLSTKTGEIATFALAVRYPHSVKATATLAKEGLPQDWIEIHTDMAANLGVSTGDYVIAERFPCLGFKSLRTQRVRVTEDPHCRFVIRVSGNSLVSQNLDFDGDVLYLMSFKTDEAIAALEKEYLNPCELRRFYIDETNSCKQPFTAAKTLDEVGLTEFPKLTPERQAEIVGDLTGVKRGTGTTVALAYNLMRIIESCVGYDDQETNLGLEVILDKVANSVFSQKHAGESLEQRCKRAICTADFKDMIAMGFPERSSKTLCSIIQREAESLDIPDLKKHFERHMTKGASNVINTIVRKKHRFYFATRANLSPVRLLEHLDSEPVDLTSHLWHRSLKKKGGPLAMPSV